MHANGTRRRFRPDNLWVLRCSVLAVLLGMLFALAAVGGPIQPLVGVAQAASGVAHVWDCGGEFEDACLAFSDFWGNGNFGCDRGLVEPLFSGKCFNGPKHLNLARYTDAMDAYTDSWTAWAAANQRQDLALDEPINWVMYLEAHNGYNNSADGYLVDPNHRLSYTDQLRGSVHWLSIDIVWHNGQVRLCHGAPAGTPGSLGVCSDFDRFYANAMKEIGAWLDRNPNDVILISIEDRFPIDDNVAGSNDRVNNPIELYLDRKEQVPGSAHRVYKPVDFQSVLPECSNVFCTAAPRWPTQRELLAAGKQVIIFSHNDPDGNNHRGGEWLWPQAEKTEVKPTEFDFEACAPEAGGSHFWQADPKKWSGVAEDRTFFGTFAYRGLLDHERVEHLARCNVTSISLDMVHASQRTDGLVCIAGELNEDLTDPCPDPDERVKRTIWSWREGDQGQNGNRALFSGDDGRWDSRNGAEQHHFACAKPREGRPGTWSDRRGEHWRVTMAIGTWGEGQFHCQAEYGTEGFVYAAPVNGFQNDRLWEALADARPHMNQQSDDVWINYAKKPDGSGWEVNPDPNVPSVTTVSVPAGAVYDGTSKVATARTTGAGGAVIATPAVSYAPGPGAPVNAGTYTASASFPGDATYLPSADSKTFTIAKASSVTTVTAGNATHDGQPHGGTATATGAGGLSRSVTVTYGGRAGTIYGPSTAPPPTAGSYTASADFPGDANHTGSLGTAAFTIAKASSVTMVTAGNATYDGQPHGGTATATGAGGLSQSVTVTYSGRAGTTYGPSTTAPTAAGSYTATAAFPGDANHTGSQASAAFTIARALLTVTAENQSRVYGAPNPAFTATASGLVNGDTLAGIGITCDTTATPTSDVGAYDIICAGAPANYDVTFAKGTLTLTKAPTGLDITSADALGLDAQGRVTTTARLTWHDGADPVAGQIVTFSAGGVSASATTDANGVATAALTLPSELYTLTASFAGDTNYQPSQAARPGVIIYQQSQFVIWGGNTPNLADTIQVGRAYQFWGAQWAKQVTGGDYEANSSFKGYADTVSADGTHWTSPPGNSSEPPVTVPPYIGVIVATQVTKNGPTISGNITQLVVLKVDAPENYRPNPGHAGTGVLVAILP